MSSASIQLLIDRRAEETPDEVFLIGPDQGRSVTYLQLQKSCLAMGGVLQEHGIGVGDTVAYAMRNGCDAAQVILGLMYHGCLATAVNLVSGANTISYVFSHSGARLVFCQDDTLSLLQEACDPGAMPVMVNMDRQSFDAFELFDKAEPVASDADGLLMYTSGTTGVPKGVVLTHRNLIAGGENAQLAHQLTAQDRGLCVLPLYHINGLCVTLMGALVSGGSLIMPGRFSVKVFWDQLADHGGTWFSVVPTQISYLLHEAENATPQRLASLRFGRSASAPLSPDVQRAFEDKFNVPIIETMGLTETAAQILSNPIDGVRKIGSPGIAYGNEVIIADERQNELPRGEEGEVCVRGPNVMRLYRANEEATAQTITPAGWLRTGDLGRMDEDGYVFITGRLKELIIKGGENIAPREVDEALYSHPDVVEAAAFARPCPRYGQRVEAGVMLAEGSGVTQQQLIELCHERLGPFKSPDVIYFYPELPKGPSGKIQRLKLAELAEQTIQEAS